MGAALWFAVRSAGVEPIRAERDRAVGRTAALRQDNTRLAAELAAAKAAAEGRSSEEARFLAVAAKALEASQTTMRLANETFENTSRPPRAGERGDRPRAGAIGQAGAFGGCAG